ncbi:MAG: methyltransferase domain-containing protein [bacterium]
MNKARVQKSFDRAAAHYEKYALVQKDAADFLANFVKEKTLLHPQTILDIGAGTGFLTERLLNFFPRARYLLNDISPAMIASSKEKFRRLDNAAYFVGDAEQAAFPEKSYDLMISNLTFQWFENLEQGISRLWKKTKCLAFSTLLQGTFSEWERACQAADEPSGLHSYPSFQNLKAHCLQLNHRLVFFEYQTKKQIFKNPREFVRHLKRTGACVPHAEYRSSRLTPIFKALPNGIETNYEIFYALLLKE